jgi:hypothetical protein
VASHQRMSGRTVKQRPVPKGTNFLTEPPGKFIFNGSVEDRMKSSRFARNARNGVPLATAIPLTVRDG